MCIVVGGWGAGARDLVFVSEAKGKYVGMLMYIRGTSDRLVSGLPGAPYVPKTCYMANVKAETCSCCYIYVM